MNLVEHQVVVTTRHGQMPALAVHPAAGGPFPPVLFYMDAPGIRQELYNMARRMARAGYYVLLPDLYYRLGTLRFDAHRREETMSKVIFNCVTALDVPKMMDDTAGMIAFVDAQAEVRPGPVGVMGYCMGGKYVVNAAGTFPERIAAAASLYGISLATDKEDSPHLFAPKITGELYFAVAETDRTAPPEMIARLDEALAAAGVRNEIVTYPGTTHGFAFPERDNYAPAAAEDTWAKMFALFARALGPTA